MVSMQVCYHKDSNGQHATGIWSKRQHAVSILCRKEKFPATIVTATTAHFKTEKIIVAGCTSLLSLKWKPHPGTWSYSIVDTWADAACIYQLVLKTRSKAACVMWAAAYGSFQLMHSSS